MAAGTAAGLLGLATGIRPLAAGFVLPAGYAATILLGAAVTGRGLPPAAWARLPLVYATMHGSWAVGFLTSPRGLGSPTQAARTRSG